MNDIDNNPVDNVDTIIVGDDINTINDNDNHSQLVEMDNQSIETKEETTGKGRPPHLPTADTRIKVYTLSTVSSLDKMLICLIRKQYRTTNKQIH
jgi:hypothetical protein